MTRNVLALAFLFSFSSAAWALQADPALPQTFDTTYAPNAGATITVNAGQSLQAAIDSAARGDTIVVQAGSTFAPVTLPSKAGTGWVHIRSSALASLPAPGTRVGPSNAANMPKILTSGSGAAVSVPSGAHHYRLIGLEIGFTGSGDNTGIVQFDDGGPDDIVFDRCFVHGNANGHIKLGIRLSGSRNAVIDSYLNQLHARNGVFEGHGIDGFNGPGPLKIVNNHIEAACENILFGGAPAVSGGVMSDIEIRRNLFDNVGDPRMNNSRSPSSADKDGRILQSLGASNVNFDHNTCIHGGAAGAPCPSPRAREARDAALSASTRSSWPPCSPGSRRPCAGAPLA